MLMLMQQQLSIGQGQLFVMVHADGTLISLFCALMMMHLAVLVSLKA
jgi:hypothetical protein